MNLFDLALSYLDDVLILLAILGGSIALSIWVRRVVRGSLARFAPAVSGFFATLIQVIIVLIGIFIAVWVAGVSGGVVLTVVAILSAGVSLALDHSVQDAIAGVKIMIFGYVRLNDYVLLLDKHEGTVVAADLFTVTLRTRERDAVIIPNRNVVDTVVTNRSIIKGQAVDVVMPIRRPYDRDKVLGILEAVAQMIDQEWGDQVSDPEVRINSIDDTDNWRIRVYVADRTSQSKVKHAIMMSVGQALQNNDVRIGSGLEIKILRNDANEPKIRISHGDYTSNPKVDELAARVAGEVNRRQAREQAPPSAIPERAMAGMPAMSATGRAGDQ